MAASHPIETSRTTVPPLAEHIDGLPTPAPRCVFKEGSAGISLFHGNCLELMDQMSDGDPGGKFDVIFADPPYFLSNGGVTCHAGRMVKVDKGAWDKSRGADLNHEFNHAWLARCQKLLKPDGTLWVSGTHHVIHSIGFAMQQLGMKMLNEIVWEKPNPPPNLSCRYFTHASETVIWAAKNERSKHLFNYQLMKSINAGKQMKSVWRFAAPSRAEKALGRHPTQKPVGLLERILLASSNEGDWVFDPFSGSSTTGVAAIRTKRQFVGCELEDEFVRLSCDRLAAALSSVTSDLLEM